MAELSNSLKRNLSVFPFIRIGISVFLGILSQYAFNIPPLLFGALGIVSLTYMAFSILSNRPDSLYGVVCLCCLYFLSGGLVRVDQREFMDPELCYGRHPVLLQVGNEVRPSAEGFRFHGRIRAFKPSVLWEFTDFSVWVRLRSKDLKPLPGDMLLVRGNLVQLVSSPIPMHFNMSKWLSNNDFAGVWEVSTGEVMQLGKGRGWMVTEFGRARTLLLSKLKKNGLPDHVFGLVSALILGERSEIDPEIREAFSVSGLVHVLAVSGMHVALVFGLFSFLLKPVRNAWLKSLLLLFCVWLYAALSGLSPSVNRAAVLYSLIIVGNAFQRKNASSLNSLIAAGVLMLLADTQYLFDLGFQLSFLAVFGIITLGNRYKFSELPRFKRYLYQALWVSIVAQMATMPVLLYHFGTFPVYFLPANLIAVPFSALLTYVSIACLLVSSIPHISVMMCKLLTVGVEAFTACVGFFAQLPFAQIEGLVPNLLQTLVLGMFFFRLTILPISWVDGLKMFMVLILCWPAMGKLLPDRRMVQESVGFVRSGQLVFLTKDGRALYWQSRMTDSNDELYNHLEQLKYHIWRLPRNVPQCPIVLRVNAGSRVKRILVVNSRWNPYRLLDPLKPDAVVLLHSSKNRRFWEYACLKKQVPVNLGGNNWTFQWF